MKIFRNVILRELVITSLAIFFVLVGITLTTELVRLLGQAASGAITSTSVAALLGFTLVSYLSVVLSLTLFVAVLMTLTRSYRDSEMVVWFASGMSLTQWIRPVLAFAVPVAIVIAQEGSFLKDVQFSAMCSRSRRKSAASLLSCAVADAAAISSPPAARSRPIVICGVPSASCGGRASSPDIRCVWPWHAGVGGADAQEARRGLAPRGHRRDAADASAPRFARPPRLRFWALCGSAS